MKPNYTILKCEIDINPFNEPIVDFIFINDETGKVNHADIPYYIEPFKGVVELPKKQIYIIASKFNLKPVDRLIKDIEGLTEFTAIRPEFKINLLKKYINLIESEQLTKDGNRILRVFCDRLTLDVRKEFAGPLDKLDKSVSANKDNNIEFFYTKRFVDVL